MQAVDPDLRYLQHTPAGAAYISQITAQESDRLARAAFRDLVLQIAPAGAVLFDFGAGPGIDARFFAERGYRVDAYDIDPRMAAFFCHHCRDLLREGRVNLTGGPYRQFIAREPPYAGDRARLVIANFAPLNLVDDLGELFVKFAALTTARGQVLANVLNPWYLPDLRSRHWWRGAPRLLGTGERFQPGPQAPHHLRLLRHFRAVSAPYFRLARVLPTGWRDVARSRYLTLLFDKRP